MVMKLDQLVNGAINVGFGAAAVAVEGGKKVLDDLNTKGEQVRKDTATPDIARSVSDMFEQAGGTISDLTEQFIQAQISWEEALSIVQTKKIVYAPDATMQAVLSDRYGRTLLIEPGIGSRVDTGTYSLMANASLLSPESTRPWLLPGDNRYEKAAQLLAKQGRRFSVSDAFAILRAVRQEGLWATRVSFVFSAKQRTVFYAENSHFDSIQTYQFPPV